MFLMHVAPYKLNIRGNSLLFVRGAKGGIESVAKFTEYIVADAQQLQEDIIKTMCVLVPDTEEVLLNIYNTLLQLRYPDITKAEPRNVEVTILTGENRISLLAWLLTEKSIYIATALRKLEGSALEDELFKYYSELGICTNKNLLLGKCTLKEQLPTLRLLLEFMKNVHINNSTSICDKDDSANDILKACLNESTSVVSLCNVKPKMSHAEALQYFEDIRNELKDEVEAIVTPASLEDKMNEIEIPSTQEENKEEDNNDPNEAFNTETENFKEAFTGINTWTNTNQAKNVSYSMDNDIKSVYSDFAKLREILKIQNEISKTNISKESNRTVTPLNGIVEEAVVYIEKFRNMFVDEFDGY